MKLLNLNINFLSEDKYKVIELILKEDPDIICLQEVTMALDGNVHKQFKVKELIDHNLDVVYRFKFFGPNFETYPYTHPKGSRTELGGLVQYGNYILSKYKFISVENIMYWRNYSQMRDWSNWLVDDNPRGVQKTVIEINGKLLTVFNNHGIYSKDRMGDERTLKECRFILELAKKEKEFIITGDFNLLPESDSIKILTEKCNELVTEHNTKTTRVGMEKVVDYLFVSKEVKVSNFEIIQDKDISDHYPMVVEFEV